MFAVNRALPAIRASSGAAFPRTQARRYATAPGAGGSNWPMALAAAGVAGLGGYIYLQRNPAVKSEISAEFHEAEAKAKAMAAHAQSKAHDLKGQATDKAHELKSQASDKAHELKGQASEKANEIKGKASDLKDQASDKAHQLKGQASEKGQELKDKAVAAGGSLAAQKDASGEGASVMGALIKDSWTPFLLTKVEPYNHNTKIYHFEFPGEDGKSKISGGQVASALLVKAPEGESEPKDEKGKPVIRPYTPISAPDQTGSLTLMIKEYKGGKLTSYISALQPGKDSLLFKGPIQKYLYKPNEFDKGLCISGGSGITPMYQLISHSLGLTEDKTKWTLVFSNVTEKDILLRKEWDSLAKQHPDRLEVKYVLDKAPYFWKGETGYITSSLISKVFPRKPEEKVMAFVCGPPPQVESVAGKKDGPRQGELKGALAELGYKAEEVFKF